MVRVIGIAGVLGLLACGLLNVASFNGFEGLSVGLVLLGFGLFLNFALNLETDFYQADPKERSGAFIALSAKKIQALPRLALVGVYVSWLFSVAAFGAGYVYSLSVGEIHNGEHVDAHGNGRPATAEDVRNDHRLLLLFLSAFLIQAFTYPAAVGLSARKPAVFDRDDG